jgi:2-polyprenyl-3-methyl-5-hydroxy-6-metoxy-1,4-benzoquinol methylase
VRPVGEGAAAERWRRALGEWAIPQQILDQATESPWHHPPKLFARRAEQALDEAPRPSRLRALEALPDGGTVLDVGVGGGAASLPLAPPAGLVIGVDSGEGMLEAFTRAADQRGVASRAVAGSWPAVAAEVPLADVVVCHHVFYNVADLVPFAAALTDHARRRVVVELSGDHPTSNLNPLWMALHGLERPSAPVAEDAAAVLAEMGLAVGFEAFERPWHRQDDDRPEMVAMLRRRLCVGPERDAEIDAFLDRETASPLRRSVALWWDGTA